jgi:hypothetical protein
MSEQLDVERILQNNPHISQEELANAREILRKLRESGVRAAGYRLVLPYSGRRVSTKREEKSDPRTVVLKRRDSSE